jgi:BolA family transcriptional regulator, general stress-responsive regulator
MTDPATGRLAPEITRRLTQALQPTHLSVSNDSHLHAGHAGDDGSGETHFSVTIEAPVFTGLSRVARQRLVNRAVGDLLAPGGIHALAIRATAPGEA